MNLTTKEKQAIRNTIKLLIKDIRKLTKNYPESEIVVFAFNEYIGNYGNEWYLKITNKEIKIIEKRKDSNSLIAKRNARNMVLDEHDYIAQYYLIKNYKEIRESIETIVNERQKTIDDNIEMMNKTKNIFLRNQKEQKKQKKATIELEVPPTNNQYQLEVSEENGTTLGKLNFNGLTLKIIASDGIKIVNKTTSKQKRNKRQEERLKDEEKTLEELRKLSREYKNYSTIEIDMPQTNNQHQIEVVEDGNKKIGTINFGRQTIRIITEGDIVLVNKKDQKTKRR